MTIGSQYPLAGIIVILRSGADADGRVLVEYADGTFSKASADRLVPVDKLGTLSEVGAKFLRGGSAKKTVLK